MDVVGNIIGKETECEVCGSTKKVTKYVLRLWDYGKPVVKLRDICARCISASKRGVL